MSDALVYLWGSFLENFWYVIVFGYGAIVGSFLNVLIYRMPLGMSVSKPASHCPNCNHYLGFWDNIPLFAFLALGGRCRYCRVPISWRYFSVELFTACLWTALFYHVAGRTMTSWIDYLAQALFISILVAVIFIDLDHFIIPDELNWVGIALGLVRDIACIAIAWGTLTYSRGEVLQQFAYLNWLPRAIPGALLYGGVMLAVSFVGFLVYAREENESLVSVARRYVKQYQELTPEDLAAEEAALKAKEAENEEEESDDEEAVAPRLGFSPAFLAILSALVLVPILGPWAAIVFALPLIAFVILTHQSGESYAGAISRFFQSNDLGAPPPPAPAPLPAAEEDFPLLPGDERRHQAAIDPSTTLATSPVQTDLSEAQLAASEADKFAIEAQTGKHGAMGLGDVKLALAIGALLGPVNALVSLFFATASGAIIGLLLARRYGRGLKLAIPFGPFMAFGAIIMMLYGTQLLAWYTNLYKPH